MELAYSTLEQRYRIATPTDMQAVEYQGNYEQPLALLNRLTKHVRLLGKVIIPQFRVRAFDDEKLLLGFSYGNHTPLRARVREVRRNDSVDYDFEVQRNGGWISPFPDGPAALYLLK